MKRPEVLLVPRRDSVMSWAIWLDKTSGEGLGVHVEVHLSRSQTPSGEERRTVQCRLQKCTITNEMYDIVGASLSE